jgi:hypothetical protein
MTTQTTTFGLFSTSINSWFRRQETGLRRRRQWHTLRGAVARAHQRFASHNPQYADSLFDMHFLTHTARPLVQRYLLGTNAPTPAEFATAWCGQFPAVVPSQDQFAEATRMAAAFLRHLDAELHS